MFTLSIFRRWSIMGKPYNKKFTELDMSVLIAEHIISELIDKNFAGEFTKEEQDQIYAFTNELAFVYPRTVAEVWDLKTYDDLPIYLLDDDILIILKKMKSRK